jgi:hypothetical protein
MLTSIPPPADVDATDAPDGPNRPFDACDENPQFRGEAIRKIPRLGVMLTGLQ